MPTPVRFARELHRLFIFMIFSTRVPDQYCLENGNPDTGTCAPLNSRFISDARWIKSTSRWGEHCPLTLTGMNPRSILTDSGGYLIPPLVRTIFDVSTIITDANVGPDRASVAIYNFQDGGSLESLSLSLSIGLSISFVFAGCWYCCSCPCPCPCPCLSGFNNIL